MSGEYTISREDWSLHRKGEIDRDRHQEKLREAIKKNLADVISEESIILSDGRKIIKVPLRSLKEYHFRFDNGKLKHTGEGSGDTKAGDILGSEAQQGVPGKNNGAGEEPGVDYYEAEIAVDELAQLIFADLSLPNLQPKKKPELVSESIEFKDIRKTGISSNIDRKRTILEAIKRNARQGLTGFDKITREDLRYRTWDLTYKLEDSAVILAMMDTSGSMGAYEKYIARSFFFWMTRFLRTKYQNVQIIFLAHHVEARETTEEEFFTKGASGGTRCSSVYRLALDKIAKHFNPDDYNIYAFHFSDGDNLSSDNDKCVQYINELLKVCNLVGYGEIEGLYYYTSTLHSALKKINNPRFSSIGIRSKSDVYSALKMFFNPHPANMAE